MTIHAFELFMLREEAVGLLGDLIESRKLRGAVLVPFPVYRAHVFGDAQRFLSLMADVQPDGLVRVLLGKAEPRIKGSSFNVDSATNLFCLIATLGAQRCEEVRQSQFSLRESQDTGPIWNALARMVRAVSKSGLWAVDPISHDRAFYRQVRFSTGVEQLPENTRLMPTAGRNYYEVPSAKR